ncbi:1-acyl-sn-glycerol-3-phosphate acyltransferase [Breoghania sp. L-A4]|uniref:lysophospholipid acyltransferase family protein n=1 Tax=Breoghania sp. L-A4 TaxID=2304600 RepID=UPI000E35BEFB|nr:1-acyl-sn-glycerol-3-phosphate acyltransferase [Breoghania sp. L-A4]AXS38753.1 1-acyl-sn-glycerol-3-phosphate acyltransferase [Breoghania sp. L-A4]
MLVLRSILFNVCFYVLIVVMMIAITPIFFIPRKWGWPAVIAWARINLWLLRVIVGMKIEVRGREHIPQGGCIVAAKHQSLWETFALLPEFEDPTFILKRELTWLPWFGWYTIKMRQIPVNRGKRSTALLAMTARAREAIDEGRQILIFPEGTRRPAGAEPVYKFGVAHLYRDLRCPCLPVALNSGLYWPRRKFLRFPGTVVIEFQPVIEPGLSQQEMQRVLFERIETASDRLIVEAARAPSPPPRARELAAAIEARAPKPS